VCAATANAVMRATARTFPNRGGHLFIGICCIDVAASLTLGRPVACQRFARPRRQRDHDRGGWWRHATWRYGEMEESTVVAVVRSCGYSLSDEAALRRLERGPAAAFSHATAQIRSRPGSGATPPRTGPHSATTSIFVAERAGGAVRRRAARGNPRCPSPTSRDRKS